MQFRKLAVHDRYRRDAGYCGQILEAARQKYRHEPIETVIQRCRKLSQDRVKSQLRQSHPRKAVTKDEINRESAPFELGIWTFLRRPFYRIHPGVLEIPRGYCN